MVPIAFCAALAPTQGNDVASCAEQARKIRRILEKLSLDIASPDEARTMLGLKGRHVMAF